MTRRIRVVVLLLAAAAGCSGRAHRSPPAPDSAATQAPAPEESGAKKPAPQSSTVEPATGVRPPPSPGEASPSAGPAATSGAPGGALAPPAVPGAQAVRLSGCVTAGDEAAARRFIARSPSSEAAPGVTVTPVAGGVRVLHRLTHACCLKAEIASRLDGDRLIVTERLWGEPCRCQCASTLETAVAVPPGRTRVTVVVERPRSDPERVHEAVVDVP